MRHHVGPGGIDMKMIWTISLNNYRKIGQVLREQMYKQQGVHSEELGRRGGPPREDDFSAAH